MHLVPEERRIGRPRRTKHAINLVGKEAVSQAADIDIASQTRVSGACSRGG